MATKAELGTISLPDNYTIIWDTLGESGFISGMGYGVGIEFDTAVALKAYIYTNGWLSPSNSTV
ncbi:hypothetical protein [Vibrio viridaestus]|uniref:hypothetical protein n=1 Tax=Vibrio viridaestus TaxID=2487322 RepID=UPI000F6126F7|nr:hypothetical protein [Vibrio viridaestus]